ncbi:MAG: TIGR02594 family protein [Alysiella sp.]|uniref:NlpC/P60 family protein n=1 Tax=Alysiella sp. TaxID=1872483 RepID=UPI0026DC1FAA|nr:TIGR02594 family protein [Alysiella sp.]MDO4434727.1 TIGR02594 family protein [Alysiella sp.]
MKQSQPLPDPLWLIEARKHIGLTEIAGKDHNPTIRNWLIALKAWWTDDETPWCGTFTAHCCRVGGRALPKHWYRARDWLNTGTRLSRPAYGCIAVFERQGGGHVGFVVGQDKNGNLLILGGNQGNRVSIAPFARSRVAGFIWPSLADGKPAMPRHERFDLPVLKHIGALSQNEQ